MNLPKTNRRSTRDLPTHSLAFIFLSSLSLKYEPALQVLPWKVELTQKTKNPCMVVSLNVGSPPVNPFMSNLSSVLPYSHLSGTASPIYSHTCPFIPYIPYTCLTTT